MTKIGEAAFAGCESLTKIIIPNSMKTIGDRAFWKCKSLKNFTIPAGVTDLGRFVLCDCDAMATVTMPKTLAKKYLDNLFTKDLYPNGYSFFGEEYLIEEVKSGLLGLKYQSDTKLVYAD